MALSHCFPLVHVFALLEAKAQGRGKQHNLMSSEEELSAEEKTSEDSSNFKEEFTTEEKDESAPVEAESRSSDGDRGKEEGGQNSKAEPDDSEVDGFCQNLARGILENPISPTESDDRSSCDSSLMDQTVASDKEAGHNSKPEPEDSEVNGLDENSPRGFLEKEISSPDSDRSSGSDTPMMDQSVVPDKEDEQHSKPEPDDSKVNGSSQNSPRGVLENALSFAYSDGSSSSDTSSVDQKVVPCGTAVESDSQLWRSLISRLATRKKRSMMRMSTFSMAMRSSSLHRALERIKSNKDRIDIGGIAKDVGTTRLSWRSFDYEELAAATNGFSQENLIGKGGHAEVYKGRLIDGQLVAVKIIIKGDNEKTRIEDFLSELGIIAHVNHPNAAQLVGFSVEGGLLLVLRFSEHGSLASVLHGSKERLEWKMRFKIATGVSEGLLYLHEGCQRRIIHRDIKASNILLTENFQPQISDFGLAKWLPDKWNHHMVFPIEGTFGYMAPEYFMHGVMNEKTDVFAFGVLLLELITGRLAVDFSRQSLVIWAKPLLEANKVSELVDPALGDAYDLKEVTRALQVASMCIDHLSTSRPSMKEVVRLLRNDDGSVEIIEQASRSKISRSPLMGAPGMEDYTCSRYLNDLHRYKQLALEQ